MELWDKPHYYKGVVAPGTTFNFDFLYLGDSKIKDGAQKVKISEEVELNVVDGVRGTCGCTKLVRKGNKIEGTLAIEKDFSATSERYVSVSKSITVYFEDGKTTNLYVSAVVDKTLNA